MKGKSEASCQNYIKVIMISRNRLSDPMIVNSEHALTTISTQVLKKYEEEDGRYLICGTNAYKPECRDYVEVVSS